MGPRGPEGNDGRDGAMGPRGPEGKAFDEAKASEMAAELKKNMKEDLAERTNA
jgi:hypothetical protein